jgi:hypothetical protein
MHFVPDPHDEELVATSFDYDTNSAVNAAERGVRQPSVYENCSTISGHRKKT